MVVEPNAPWRDRIRSSVARLGAWLTLRTGTMAAMLAAITFMASLSAGSRAASGSDPYGYVSQARLWWQGSLIQPEPLARTAAWPNATATLSPLGYRPGTRMFASVPTYAPGLPLLMVVARAIGGACSIYLVVPLTAGLLVWLTYLLGLRTGDRLVAIGAAALMATSPTLLFMMMWPMSDVPVSAFWLAAILAGAAATTTARIIGCAALCGIAILIRPNLAPLAIVPAGLVLWPTLALGPREGFRRALWLAVGVAPFLATIAVMNATLFGSPFESGYGSLAGLYRTNRIVTNGSRHVSWLAESQGPLVFAFVLGVAWQFGARGTASLRWGIAFCALLWIAYLPYHSFSDWWYLRFLLPAFPILFVLAVSGVAAAASWLGMTARTIVTALFVTAVAWHGVGFAHSKLVPSIGEGEQRYIEMGLYAATLPPDAVFLSVQHTGSIRYYSGRTTLRFDVLDPDWLDRTVEILEGMGRRPYVVLEQWEEGLFRERFRGQASLARLARGPIAVLDAPIGVTVYDFRADAAAPAHVHRIPHVPRWICCEPHW